MSERKNNQIMHAKINWSDQSRSFPRQYKSLSLDNKLGMLDDHYLQHESNRLTQRWLTCTQSSFAIAQTGFAAGFSFLLICRLFEQFLVDNPDKPLKRLFFSAFEEHPLCKKDVQFAVQHWPLLSQFSALLVNNYPLALSGCHRIHIQNVSLDLWIDKREHSLASLHVYPQGLFDYWLIDAQCCALSQLSDPLFKQIKRTSKDGTLLVSDINEELLKQRLQANSFLTSTYQCESASLLIGQLQKVPSTTPQGQHYIANKTNDSRDIAIIGGGISSACLSLSLIKRGYNVTLYCKEESFAIGASGNRQGALYPLLNAQHNDLSQLFANSFLYARNYVHAINTEQPFDFDLSGLLQLYYDSSAAKKLDKILQADLPHDLVQKVSASETDTLAGIDIGQSALLYKLGGWLSPSQMVKALFEQAKQSGLLNVCMKHELFSFEQQHNGWLCHFKEKSKYHDLLVLTTAMHTLDFKQCEALPLSAARGQVTHIDTNPELHKLKLTLCHEGYLTPINQGVHCMGATFKRHTMETGFSAEEQIDNKNKLAKCIKNKQWIAQINTEHTQANVGIRCTTRDHFPYMGGIPDYEKTKFLYKDATKKMPSDNIPFHDNLFILTGLGSRGLNTAPLLAETLASQINHEPLPLSSSILSAMQCHRQWLSYLKKGKTLKF